MLLPRYHGYFLLPTLRSVPSTTLPFETRLVPSAGTTSRLSKPDKTERTVGAEGRVTWNRISETSEEVLRISVPRVRSSLRRYIDVRTDPVGLLWVRLGPDRLHVS